MTTSQSPAIAAETPELVLLARLTAKLAPAIEMGDVPAGLRRIIPILGGTVNGPILHGEIIPGGADWNTWNDQKRSGILAAHYAIRLDDGTVIGVTNTGRHTIPAEGAPILTHPVLEAPAGAHGWLNHIALLGTLRPFGEHGDAVQLEFWWARSRRDARATEEDAD